MIIKKAEYQRCSKCGRGKQISDDVFRCDNCKKEFLKGRLNVTIFHSREGEAEHIHFCCWKCVLEYLPKIKSNDFVTLPFLSYSGEEIEGCMASDLIELINK